MLFWRMGRISIWRHCDGVFTLEIDGVEDMGPCSFEDICRYLRLEYDVL